ncbi:T9SS type B sorting domain-containing protein [Flavobacterium aquidurense]|uniref:Gliding motility-associated C-terminal domain-containing protein n=1 Tax=Flavobacterium aquidurense TaxID=362413 RepID=A0A0Q1BIN0_9FLAO|nr:T9SS type B sorting domain-containing protein [Flavobacterium aquidurense]KQB40570.1 Gliding motility-associated C-terminal domain-containing protein [Flavobacterium aquidurense]
MKNRITWFLFLIGFFGYAQFTPIPDPNFEKALIDLGIDSGVIDGKVLTAQISEITSLEIPGKNISDLTGIEAFVKLEQLNIGAIDNDPTQRNRISTLNLSSNLYLTFLICSFNDLTQLDLSNNIFLKLLYAENNKLTSIDISKNIALTTFLVRNNSLATIDLSKNTSLNSLNLDNNLLLNLDIFSNLLLTELYCAGNQLATLDIYKNTQIISLNCSSNKLSSLNTSQNVSLNHLKCENNQISSLELSKNVNLKTLYCSTNQLTGLNVSKNKYLDDLFCDSNQLSTIDIAQNLILKSLSIEKNQLSNLEVSNNTALVVLHCSSNKLSEIDVSKNIALTHLLISDNQLKNLDLSKNPVLAVLYCNNNQLVSLNLKNGSNSKISYLDLKSNLNLSCIQVDNKSYSDTNWSFYKDASAMYADKCNASTTLPPVLSASGDQFYCPTDNIKIVTDFSITHDPGETGTQAVYIQISSGYSSGFDLLKLLNPSLYPNIKEIWDASSGKLTLTNPAGIDLLYSDIVAAVKDVVFTNSSATASGTRTFSITIGQANYLPSTQHYYLFVPSIGITWSASKTAAEARNYYGLKGYLATILSTDEAKLIGEQASGTGWIGGSDAETDNVWKWVTGPEAGTIFWNGTANGSTPNFAFWNNGEPNNQGGNEKYAHVTQPGVGTKGSWNDLSNTGDPSGNYQPKGYVVEYGGMPGELPLKIAASTKITIPVATPDPNLNSVCDSGSFTLNATATAGATISWYDSAIGGNLLKTGNSYTTPVLNTTTTYYVDAGCESNRKAVVATVNLTPNQPVATSSTVYNCGSGSVVLEANANVGIINWFTSSTGGTSVNMGNSFTTPVISSNITYYAEASNSMCINSNRTPVNVVIYTPPAVINETLDLCQFQKITLDAGITGMTYLWNNGATSPTIDANAGGTYTVDVTSPAPENCTSRKTIIVNERLVPQIDRIDVNGTTAVIYLKKELDYFEYSVDGFNFQDSNVFYNVPGGLQNAVVREKSGCGQTTQNFVVLVFPAFFTPNNDSYNDLWEVTGMENYPEAEVTIFDRYGKLIAQLNTSKMSWDGTFEQMPLPASDYWYALKIDNSKPVLRGHFALKR